MSAVAAPPEFTCPITGEVMTDPVLCDDGHTYERDAIREWLSRNPSSPLTRQTMSQSGIRPNHSLKAIIERWQKQEEKARAQQKPTIPIAKKVQLQPPVPSAPPASLYQIQNPVSYSYQSYTPPLTPPHQTVLTIPATPTPTQQGLTVQQRKILMNRIAVLVCLFILLIVILSFIQAGSQE